MFDLRGLCVDVMLLRSVSVFDLRGLCVDVMFLRSGCV